jgi:hypothetical protein
MTAVVTTAQATHPMDRPLQPQGCYASLRDRLRRPLTLEPLPACGGRPTSRTDTPQDHDLRLEY